MIRDNLPSPDYAFAYILSTSAYPEKIEQIIMQQKSETTWWKKKVEVLLNRDPHHPQAMILQEKKNSNYSKERTCIGLFVMTYNSLQTISQSVCTRQCNGR